MTAMMTMVITEASRMPPRYMNADVPSMPAIMATRPISAMPPTASSASRTLRSKWISLFAPSWFDGHTKASHAPMSRLNARVSVP